MATIIYIHGFLSSPLSHKCQLTKRWLKERYPEVSFLAPHLSSYPRQARDSLYESLKSCSANEVCAIGSSLGGFWATHLVENQVVDKAVLVNPGVMPQNRFHEFVGCTLKNYYSEEEYVLSENDLADLCACDEPEIRHPDKYWLMVQKGDETLDYRLAVEKYQNCKQLVEEGGSHTFEGYENWLNEIMGFFGICQADP